MVAANLRKIRKTLETGLWYSVKVDGRTINLMICQDSSRNVESVKDATSRKAYWIADRAFLTRDVRAIFVLLPKQAVLAIVDRGQHGVIRRAIPLSDIVRPRPGNPAVAGPLKQAAARTLGREPHFTAEERKLLGMDRAEEARIALERAEKETERLRLLKKEKTRQIEEERLKVRQKRVEQVLVRAPITAYVTDATDRRNRRVGLPITVQELEELLGDLPVGKRLVLIFSNGVPFKALKLDRAKDGTVHKVDVAAVTATAPAKARAKDVADSADEHRAVLVESRKSRSRFHVRLCSSREELRALRPTLPSGARVAVPLNDKAVEVYAVQKDGASMTTVGHCDIVGA